MPAFDREDAEILLDIIAADHVEDDIDAAIGRRLSDHRDEIFVLVVDAARCTELFASIAFVAAAGGREDRAGVERLSELDRDRADAGGAAMDEDRFAGGEAPALENIVPDGEEGLGHSRGLDHAEAFWHGQALRLRRDAIARITAAGDERADLIADLETIDAQPDGDDRAGDLEPRNVGRARRRRI